MLASAHQARHWSARRALERAFASARARPSWSLSRTFTDEDCASFAKASGDMNPIHDDESSGVEARGKSRMKEKVVHGMLSASAFGALLAREYPGAVYAAQELKFRAPVRVGEEMIAEITLVKRSGTRAKYETVLRRARCGTVCVDGEALAILPES